MIQMASGRICGYASKSGFIAGWLDLPPQIVRDPLQLGIESYSYQGVKWVPGFTLVTYNEPSQCQTSDLPESVPAWSSRPVPRCRVDEERWCKYLLSSSDCLLQGSFKMWEPFLRLSTLRLVHYSLLCGLWIIRFGGCQRNQIKGIPLWSQWGWRRGWEGDKVY